MKKSRGQIHKELLQAKEIYDFLCSQCRNVGRRYYRDYNRYTAPGNSSWDLGRKHARIATERMQEAAQKLSKCNLAMANVKGRSLLQYREKTLADLILEGSDINLHERRFCSPRGRSLELDLKMYRLTDSERKDHWGRSYKITEAVMTHTPVEMGLRRMQGYMFDGEYQKFLLASSDRAYCRNTKGLYTRAERNSTNQELVEEANKHRKRIKDTMYIRYLGGGGENRTLKLHQIYVLSTDAPKVVNRHEEEDREHADFIRWLDTHMAYQDAHIIRRLSRRPKTLKKFLTISEKYGKLMAQFKQEKEAERIALEKCKGEQNA